MMMHAVYILNAHTEALGHLDEALEAVQAAPVDNTEEELAIYAFFHKEGGHAIGQALALEASGQVTAHQAEAVADQQLDMLRGNLESAIDLPGFKQYPDFIIIRVLTSHSV